MLNQVVLVGRIEKLEKNNLILKVSKSFKNDKGIYESDLIPCVINGNIAKATNEYCNIGDVIAIKGTLEYKDKLYVLADKVSFLSSKKVD